jgi:hypothetical protein
MSTPTHDDNQRQQEPSFDLPRHTLRCLRYLAERCDGAHRRDGRGFSKTDTRFGRSLAGFAQLSPHQTIMGAKLVSNYPKQLACGGLCPPTQAQIATYAATHEKEIQAKAKKKPVEPEEEESLEPPDWWYSDEEKEQKESPD